MDSPAPSTVTVRGKDLPGAVMVMPLGLDAAIKKRVSGEFKSEKSGSSLTFANVSGGGGNSSSFQQQQQQSSNFSSHMSSSSSGMSAAKQMSSSNHVSSSSQMSSSMMTNQQRSFQQTTSSTASKQVSGGFQDFSLATHGEEIKQSGLKDQLYSAITDLESEIDPEFKENISSNLMKSPTPIKSPHQQESFSPTPPSKHEYFSPPPLEPVSKPEPVSFSIAEPVSVAMEPVRNQMAPIQQQFEEPVSLIQNGFSDYSQDVTDFNSFNSNIDSSFMSSQKQESSFMSSQKQETSFMSSQKQESSFMSSQKQEPVFLGSENSYSASKQESFSSSSTLQRGIQEADSGSHLHGSGSHLQLQESDSNSSLLQKIMTPANPDYDSSSLKRRDPRKMYTDSSFYNKNHPSVADQVEMAHKLTSALFKDKAYLNRMKKSGEESDTDDFSGPKRDAVPNMKLVMNPEGKLHEWNDMDPSELPNAALMASHASAAPSLPSPDIINPMIEDLNSNTGRGGELFAKRRKRAENWVVDENNINQNKPSAFADKFIQEQQQQQQQFQHQQQQEQAVASAEEKEYRAQQQQKLQQEKEFAQQQFRSQQQFKQEQSLELRKQQEEAMMMSSEQESVDMPPNFKKTDLKIRSFTPSLDLSCHNVQGINVWANTAPRGWGAQKGAVKANLPTVSVSPATPSVDQQQLQIQQQQMIREEQMRMEQEQQKLEMSMQQEQMFQQEQKFQQEQMLMEQQMEKQRLEDQRMMEEQLRIEEEQKMQEERKFQEQQRLEEQRMEEIRRHEEEQRQMEEQRRIEEEQHRMQEQQRMEQQKMEQQMMEQQRMEQQRMEQQKMEQQRMEQQRMEQQRMEQQKMEQQRIEQQRMEQQRIEQQRMEQQRVEQQRMEQQQIMEQQRMEQQRIEEQKRLAGMEMMNQQESFNQSMNFQQQSMEQSSHQQQTVQSSVQQMQYTQQQQIERHSELYESTEFNGGVLKGYKPKGEEEMPNGTMNHKPSMKMVQNNGIFGGITGDHNELLNDIQFDSKKHSVKSLVGHFSKVKPKAQIPVQYLPEQRQYNGDQGPSLNYLSQSAEGSEMSKITASASNMDIDASRKEYESRKQMNQENTSSTTSTTTNAVSSNSQKTSVETRSRSEMSAEKKQLLNTRRQSLKDLLFFDTENNRGSSAGIIDPSAILRGEKASVWNRCDTSHPPPASSAAKLYISKPPAPATSYSQTLPRSFKSKSKPCDTQTSQILAINQQLSSKPPPVVPQITTQFVDSSNSSLTPEISSLSQVDTTDIKSSFNSQSFSSHSQETSTTSVVPNASSSASFSQNSLSNSKPSFSSSLQLPDSPEYEAVVHSSNKVFTSISCLTQQQHSMTTAVVEASGQLPTNTNTTNCLTSFSVVGGLTPVIESSDETLDNIITTAADDLHPTVSLLSSLPTLNPPRSSASTPLPTTPFPSLDHPGSGLLFSTAHSNLSLPFSSGAGSTNIRSRTPILVTTRPSSVIEGRSRHMSKEDIARMMAELNSPLPALVPIPQDIRASPLLFTSRTPGTPTLLTGSKM